MKKKENHISSSDTNNIEKPKQKERHIVSWSQEEDDILREQIGIHGTENWAIIASKFKDKTTRQCRRRWFTYLNSDFKKGGWSPAEDMLLCEAQKIFGNRWTEIAKVVSGRTDNAVKNRFTTLCKKRAKNEALAKENTTTSYINLNNKRVIFPSGLDTSETAAPLKKLRTYIAHMDKHGIADHLLRPPFAVLAEKENGRAVDLPSQPKANHIDIVEASDDGSANNQVQGTFLKKDDPKVLALIQQAELLSSLAAKVNSDKTEWSLESAWMVLQDFLKQNQENDLLVFRNLETEVQLEQFKELMEDLRSNNEGRGPSWKEPDMYDSSPASSEYSTGSTLLSNVQDNKTDESSKNDNCLLHQETGYPDQSDDQHCLPKESGIQQNESSNEEKNVLACDNVIDNNIRGVCENSNSEFSSPLHVTPFFRALAAAIPSPKFSESEKHFLMKTLGMDSTSQNSITNPSQPPSCKRSLLHCL